MLKRSDNGFLIFSAKYFCKCFLMFLATVCVRNLRAGCPNVYGVSLQNNCEPQNRTHASCKGQGSGQSEAQKSAKYEIRSTEEREIRWCAVEGLLQHISKLDRWKYYHLVAIPTWRGGPPWSHHSFGERFYLESLQMAYGEPHFSWRLESFMILLEYQL